LSASVPDADLKTFTSVKEKWVSQLATLNLFWGNDQNDRSGNEVFLSASVPDADLKTFT
jgi:hypothetical protein